MFDGKPREVKARTQVRLTQVCIAKDEGNRGAGNGRSRRKPELRIAAVDITVGRITLMLERARTQGGPLPAESRQSFGHIRRLAEPMAQELR